MPEVSMNRRVGCGAASRKCREREPLVRASQQVTRV